MSSIAETNDSRGAARFAPPPVSRWAAVGLGVALAFFTATAALSYRNQQRLAETEELAAGSRLLIGTVGEIVSLLQAAETAQRAYLFTTLSDFEAAYDFNASYQEAVGQIPKRLEELRGLAQSAEQRGKIESLDAAATSRLDHLKKTLEIYNTDGLAAAQREVAEGRGTVLMKEVREEADQFREFEQGILNQRRRDAARATRVTHISDLLAAALGLGLAALAFVRLRREFLGRHAVTQDLDEQRELLQVTLLSIGDAVVTTDEDGRVRSLNAVAERLLSWPAAEAVGRASSEVFRVVNEQTRAAVENPALRAIRERQGVRQAQSSLLIARDNTERRIDGSAAPIRTPDGRVLGAVLTFRDVTDRRRAEDALRRSEERLRRALRASRTVAWEIDVRADVVVRSENVIDLLGMAPFGPVAEHVSLMHPDDRTAVEAALGRAMRGEADDYAVEYRAALADGRTLWIADKGELRRDDRSEPTHLVGVSIDVTELKQAEEELREADRRKDRFLATLAHELRNPLAPISNALQAWPFVKNDPTELERLRETMDRQVAQMTRLIDDLLDVSRITRGKIVLRKERTDIATVIEAAVEGVRPLLDSRGHALQVAVPDSAPPIDGDVARLVQVFTNLLHNAAKYTDEGGRIEVTVRRDADPAGGPGWASVSVADTGTGIPRPMLSRIFDMFSQVDQTLDRSHGGLGIGLTLVKTLVELHGGRIEAQSGGPGAGSTFIVRLPIAAEPDMKAEPPAAEVPSASPIGTHLPSLRMLVVDDMRPSARTLAMMLKGIGQVAHVAHDGTSALAAVEEFRPDIVLLDIAMPGMDGYEVCRRIRQRPGRQPLLVALTGYGQEEDRQRAFDAGFDRHLVKPTSLDALRTLLAGAEPIDARPAEAG